MPCCFGFWSLLYSQKKKKEKNQLINQNLCKKFLVDKLSRVYLLKALLKPIKVTHSKKTDFFPVCCIHLRLVVKYKRFISEFPLKYLCGSSLLVGILQDLISAKSRLSYWDYYQKFIKLEMLIGIQLSFLISYVFLCRKRKESLAGETNASAVPRAQIESITWTSCTCRK